MTIKNYFRPKSLTNSCVKEWLKAFPHEVLGAVIVDYNLDDLPLFLGERAYIIAKAIANKRITYGAIWMKAKEFDRVEYLKREDL